MRNLKSINATDLHLVAPHIYAVKEAVSTDLLACLNQPVKVCELELESLGDTINFLGARLLDSKTAISFCTFRVVAIIQDSKQTLKADVIVEFVSLSTSLELTTTF